jgi:hypothetical protein
MDWTAGVRSIVQSIAVKDGTPAAKILSQARHGMDRKAFLHH